MLSWFTRTANSSIGKKALMSLTGLLLIGFLVAHLAGNFTFYADSDGEAFNAAREETSNYLPEFIKEFSANVSEHGDQNDTVGDAASRHILKTLPQLDKQPAASAKAQLVISLKMMYLVGFLAKVAG